MSDIKNGKFIPVRSEVISVFSDEAFVFVYLKFSSPFDDTSKGTEDEDLLFKMKEIKMLKIELLNSEKTDQILSNSEERKKSAVKNEKPVNLLVISLISGSFVIAVFVFILLMIFMK